MGKGSPDNHTTSNTPARNTNVRFEVTNFGPIKKGTIDLRPLTVFVGPSNTGKTYFAVLIYALHRILDGFPRLPAVHRSYSYLEWRHLLPSRILMDPDMQKELRILLEKLEAGDRDLRLSEFPKNMRDGITHLEWLQNDIEKEIIRCFDVNSVSDLTRLSDSPNGMNVSLVVGEEDRDLWRLHMKISESDVVADGQVEDMVLFPKVGMDAEPVISVFFPRVFFLLKNIIDRGAVSTRELRNPSEELQNLSEEFVDKLLYLIFDEGSVGQVGTYYLPAARSSIMESHRVIASSLVARSTRAGLERFPELPTFSGVMADFIQRVIMYEERGSDDGPMKKIADQLENGALDGRILTTKPLPGGYPEFVYRPQNTEQNIRLARASSMVSELAPVVLFLRGAIGQGDTFIIEEPEAHLHPAAQTQMAATLARMVRAGVRVVVTTHSDWLLKEIGNLMREGALGEQIGQSSREEEPPSSLRPSEVGIWLFHKDGAASGSTVEEIPFDLSEGIEPQDYEEVAEALYNRSADLQNRLEEAGGGTKQ